MELKDVFGEIESDGADLVHGRLLEWALTPPLWHADAVGGVHTIRACGQRGRAQLVHAVHHRAGSWGWSARARTALEPGPHARGRVAPAACGAVRGRLPAVRRAGLAT